MALLTILLVLAVPASGRAGTVVALPDHATAPGDHAAAQGGADPTLIDQPLGPALDLLRDPGGRLTLTDIARPDGGPGPAAGGFTPSRQEAPSYARTHDSYWARVTIDNPTTTALNRLLVLTYPYQHSLDLYIRHPDGRWEARHIREGAVTRGTDARHRYPLFALSLAPGRTLVVLRVQHYFATFPLYLRTGRAQAADDRRDVLLHGITFGIMIIAAAYQLALVLMAKVDSGLSLLAYALISLLYIYGQLGYPWEQLPPAWASHFYRVVVGNLPVAAGQIFAMRFLELRRAQPRTHALLAALTALLLLDVPLHVIDPASGAGIAQALTLLGSVVVLVAGIRLARHSVNARFFLLGFVPIIAVAVVWSLRAGGVLAPTVWTEAALYAPNALGLVLFTFGVAYRIGRERQQREQALAASEQALRRANDQLEARVAARTAELSDSLERLRHSQDALVRAEKMASLGQLVAGVAHEINTPIGVALTTASHLAERADAMETLIGQGQLRRSDLANFMEDARESARLLVANVSRAASLVQSFKQVAADQSSEEGRRVDLGAYLGEVLASLSPSLRRHGHEAAVVCPHPVSLATYPGLLAQVVGNLVTNSLAHAYTPGQRGHLTLRVEPLTDDPTQPGGALIVYTDDGQGIDPAILPRIFDPFFTTRRGTGGTGLGLHIVYNLVTLRLKGSVIADANPGGGARFTLRLPDLGDAVALPAIPPASPS